MSYVTCLVGSAHQSPSLAVSRLRSAQSITILLLRRAVVEGGGCHEANNHIRGNGCSLSGRLSSCTDQGFGYNRCAVVPV